MRGPGALGLLVALAACETTTPIPEPTVTVPAAEGALATEGALAMMADVPRCTFGFPGNTSEHHSYFGYVYRYPAPDMEVLPGRQIVDMKEETTETDELWDVIHWECPEGITALPQIEADPFFPEEVEGFDLRQILGGPDGQLTVLTFETDMLPKGSLRAWNRNFSLILVSTEGSQVVGRARVRVEACRFALPRGVTVCTE